MAVTQSLLNAEVLGGGFENHAVNDLFGQMHLVEPDTAFITGLGLLHGNVEPVLLFHRITAAFVAAGLVGLFVLFAVGVVESLAKGDSAHRAARDGGGIAFGKHTAESRAARAQADYDCWMFNAMVASQAAAASQCRASLGGSLSRLEADVRPAPPPPPPPPEPAPPPAPAPTASADYTVYFDFDSWTLTAEDLAVLTQVINTVHAGGQTHITVVGHTDTSGPADYNQHLSVERAHVVVEALVDMGAPRKSFKVWGVGETDLAVQTGDGVREPKNRRTVIDLAP